MRKAALFLLLMLAGPVMAEIDGHGPDAWRVSRVAADDVLNMRMGPGTNYPVIDRLAPDARGLQQITCVPLLIQPYFSALSDAERAALPQRWCLMRSADLTQSGWVAQRFLAEDSMQGTTGPDEAPPKAQRVPRNDRDADASAGEDVMPMLADDFMSGYARMDAVQVLDRITAGLAPSNSVFLPHADINPLALAILALDNVDGPRDRVRYRITQGIAPIPNPPKASPLPLSFIQVDRLSLGGAIRDELAAAHGAGIVAPPEAFDVGPHVSWRLVSAPVMGMRADIHAIGRRDIPDNEAATMSCLGSPCLFTGMSVFDLVPWGPEAPGGSMPDRPYAVMKGGLPTPAAMLDMLTDDRSFAAPETDGPVVLSSPPEPFLEAVIEVNLATDSVIASAMRLDGGLDDSVAAEWNLLSALPTDQAAMPAFYRAETYACHRGPEFPPPGGLCP